MIAQLILFVSEKYVLIVNPGVVYFGSNISVILTCTITDANNEIQWWRDDELLYTIMRDANNHYCTGFEAIKTTFDLECDPDNRQFMLIIPPNAVSYGIGDTNWACSSINGSRSNSVKFIVTGNDYDYLFTKPTHVSSYQEGGMGPINRFDTATFVCLSQAWKCISNVICRELFCVL